MVTFWIKLDTLSRMRARQGILDGVVLAEIELDSADQKIELPDWIGKEVTGDPSYRKVNLLAQRIAALGEKGSALQMVGPTR